MKFATRTIYPAIYFIPKLGLRYRVHPLARLPAATHSADAFITNCHRMAQANVSVITK